MKILIATDGSTYSEAAVEESCRLMKDGKKAQIRLVSVYEPPIMAVAAPYASPVGYNPALEKEMRGAAEKAVDLAEKTIRESCPDAALDISTKVLCGIAARAIIEEAADWDADLIVTGSHGYGFWSRTFLGSVSNAIIHHAPCSVLVVREKQPAQS